ncbi:hypothetical protein NM688_g8222 [Phlebia brevispora]|uniref:Uncharacterized protein n=1 Tax=Phlebia brevispora TaxID=194682 RepID=A0ACC1RVQ8_9APHY|nr:hypothetical protein NM688_g8222 [Phlebia brevispora]
MAPPEAHSAYAQMMYGPEPTLDQMEGVEDIAESYEKSTWQNYDSGFLEPTLGNTARYLYANSYVALAAPAASAHSRAMLNGQAARADEQWASWVNPDDKGKEKERESDLPVEAAEDDLSLFVDGYRAALNMWEPATNPETDLKLSKEELEMELKARAEEKKEAARFLRYRLPKSSDSARTVAWNDVFRPFAHLDMEIFPVTDNNHAPGHLPCPLIVARKRCTATFQDEQSRHMHMERHFKGRFLCPGAAMCKERWHYTLKELKAHVDANSSCCGFFFSDRVKYELCMPRWLVADKAKMVSLPENDPFHRAMEKIVKQWRDPLPKAPRRRKVRQKDEYRFRSVLGYLGYIEVTTFKSLSLFILIILHYAKSHFQCFPSYHRHNYEKQRKMDSHSSRAKSTRPIYIIFGSLAAVLLVWYVLLPSKPSAPIVNKAVAVLKGDSGVGGTVIFTQSDPSGPVTVTGDLAGLDPSAQRGFHIHVSGDLSKGCASAGAHFNPFNKNHGAPSDRERHAGDLGNIESNEYGNAKFTLEDKIISLNGPTTIVGRSVVLHAGTDDLGQGDNEESLKTGNAGPRAACAVIGLA